MKSTWLNCLLMLMSGFSVSGLSEINLAVLSVDVDVRFSSEWPA